MASTLVLIAVFLLLLLIPILMGVPVAYSIGITSVLLLVLPIGPVFSYDAAMDLIVIRMFRGSLNFIFIALPLYLLAGRLLINSGAVDSIFEFANAVVGPIQGGIAQVNVMASIVFSGMSGSAMADAAGLGVVEYSMMKDAGYDDDIAVGVTGASTIIGPVFPPSIILIIYGAIAGVSIGQLFLGGVVPGLLMAGLLFVTVYIKTKRRGYPTAGSWDLREIASTGLEATPALITVAIIIGGLLSGVFTATEAGAVAALWALLIGVFYYDDLTVRTFYDAAWETTIDTSALLLILATAMAYAFVVVAADIPSVLAESLLALPLDPLWILLLIVVVLLLIGMVLGPLTVMILFLPILAPNFGALGIDPLHFGIVMVIALMIGMLTPPVGAVLFILEQVTKVPLVDISRAMVPFYIPLLLTLLLVIVIPETVTYLPENFFASG